MNNTCMYSHNKVYLLLLTFWWSPMLFRHLLVVAVAAINLLKDNKLKRILYRMTWVLNGHLLKYTGCAQSRTVMGALFWLVYFLSKRYTIHVRFHMFITMPLCKCICNGLQQKCLHYVDFVIIMTHLSYRCDILEPHLTQIVCPTE